MRLRGMERLTTLHLGKFLWGALLMACCAAFAASAAFAQGAHAR